MWAYLQTVLRWDRSSIINVGEKTLACVFIGLGPLDLRRTICPAALHTQQLSRPSERAALASCFVEAPERHCKLDPKLEVGKGIEASHTVSTWVCVDFNCGAYFLLLQGVLVSWRK
ncbi:hypothetical protein GOODEAATRI_020624 [Goodea atripinnis]|uniref:Uncharacterized protein n=1 Tax=Goodea atripinnis TaxID=208336 RepID=A0ABV0NY15_9TELE